MRFPLKFRENHAFYLNSGKIIIFASKRRKLHFWRAGLQNHQYSLRNIDVFGKVEKFLKIFWKCKIFRFLRKIIFNVKHDFHDIYGNSLQNGRSWKYQYIQWNTIGFGGQFHENHPFLWNPHFLAQNAIFAKIAIFTENAVLTQPYAKTPNLTQKTLQCFEQNKGLQPFAKNSEFSSF